jgi:hypothetical protein
MGSVAADSGVHRDIPYAAAVGAVRCVSEWQVPVDLQGGQRPPVAAAARLETGYEAEAVRRAMASRRWATASTLRQNARAS